MDKGHTLPRGFELRSFLGNRLAGGARAHLLDDFSGVNATVNPVDCHAGLADACFPCILDTMGSWKFRQIGWVDIDDTALMTNKVGPTIFI